MIVWLIPAGECVLLYVTQLFFFFRFLFAWIVVGECVLKQASVREYNGGRGGWRGLTAMSSRAADSAATSHQRLRQTASTEAVALRVGLERCDAAAAQLSAVLSGRVGMGVVIIVE